MYKVNDAEKINVSAIVSILNRKSHDCAIYEKHRATVETIEAQLEMWRCVIDPSSPTSPVAFMRIYDIDTANSKITYNIFHQDKRVMLDAIESCIRHLFDTYSCNKIVTDIVYDRSEYIKLYISMGGGIEVRKRQHLFLDGKFCHVVEMAIFRDEVKYE
jgi:RimJ/RimL family protein N-acetyltransferase